jgi:hypothetical protein
MLVFDTCVQPLTAWYDWLDANGYELGRDYYWSHDPESGMWAIRLVDARQEMMIMLKYPEFTYRPERKADGQEPQGQKHMDPGCAGR